MPPPLVSTITDCSICLSLPSFAGGIAGVASGLPLGFQGGFPRNLLSEFRIAGLLLGFQSRLTSGSFGGLRSGQGSSLTSLIGQLGGFSLGDAGIASHPDLLPCPSPLDGGRTPCALAVARISRTRPLYPDPS